MRKVLSDLWQTRTDSPFPGLTTHAFLWTGRNALFYSTATDADFSELEDLGGVSDQYLSHRDEAGPMLTKIADHFDSTLHAPAAELLEIGQHAHVDVPLGSRHVDVNGIEIIPTPGHSPGSTCYLVNGAEGAYLFTGDTLVVRRRRKLVGRLHPRHRRRRRIGRQPALAADTQPRCGDFQRIPGRLGRAPYPARTLDGPYRRGAERPVGQFARLRVNGVE